LGSSTTTLITPLISSPRRAAINALKPKPAQNNRQFVAWRLRLKNGVRSATEGELDAAVSWLEGSEIVFGGVVFFGIALEVALAILHPPYDAAPNIWGSPIADAFVALGVLGEVVASARVTICQGELSKRSNDRLQAAEQRAADASKEAAGAQTMAFLAMGQASSATNALAVANERAARLEKEAADARERAAKLEAELIPRRLTVEAQEAIRDLIAPFAGTPFNVLSDAGAELPYQQDFIGMLRSAGWVFKQYSADSITLPRGMVAGRPLHTSGLGIRVNRDAPPAIRDAAHTLVMALAQYGGSGPGYSLVSDPSGNTLSCTPDAVHIEIFKVR
jgi:hypothetical protein